MSIKKLQSRVIKFTDTSNDVNNESEINESGSDLNLHKISKTGKLADLNEKSYNNLTDKPTLSTNTQGQVKLSSDANPITITNLGTAGNPTFASVTSKGSTPYIRLLNSAGTNYCDLIYSTSAYTFGIYPNNSSTPKFMFTGTGNFTATGTITANSDKRLKNNIKEYVSNKSILDLNVYEFDYKDSDVHTVGCIAQELKTICPEIVHEDTNGYLSVEDSKVVYLLLNEVKKLRKELDELKNNME